MKSICLGATDAVPGSRRLVETGGREAKVRGARMPVRARLDAFAQPVAA
jgi:hypothetical protein